MVARHLLVPEAEIALQLNNSPDDLRIDGVSWTGFGGTAAPCAQTIKAGASFTCATEGVVADLPLTGPYWHQRADAARYDFEAGAPFGAPFAPSPFRAVFALTIAGVPVHVGRTIQYRYDSVIAGEKRMDIQVVPAFAVTTSPSIAGDPRAGAGASAGSGAAGPRDRSAGDQPAPRRVARRRVVERACRLDGRARRRAGHVQPRGRVGDREVHGDARQLGENRRLLADRGRQGCRGREEHVDVGLRRRGVPAHPSPARARPAKARFKVIDVTLAPACGSAT